MAGKEIAKQNGKEEEQRQYKAARVLYRWLFLFCAILFVVTAQSGKALSYATLETMAIAIVYNIIASLGILRIKKATKIPVSTIYLDIVFLSIFSFLSGGIKSDVYILFFFVLFYYGISNETSHSIKVSLFCVIFYTVSCLYVYKTSSEFPNFFSLLVKDGLILIGAYGISQVRGQVKKFDELRKKEFKIARTDRLTGLANRHYFDQKLVEEALHADKTGGKLNVLIFDLDNFKHFNDTYGHIAGDKLLELFADIIKQNIRNTDIPVRYGGEEFLILIRDLDIVIAKSVGDRIRWQLEKQKIYLNDPAEKRMVTVSCGVSQYPCDSANIKETVELADRALYHAKENGKNSVYTYKEICSKGA